MTKLKNILLSWNLKSLAKAMRLTEEDVRTYFMDGRRVSFLVERNVLKKLKGWRLARSEAATYDLIDDAGRKWEARSISARGVYFSPSNQVGSGRKFDEAGFFKKLDKIEGYLLADICGFPKIEVRLVKSRTVRNWYKSGKLGKRTQISRNKILRMLNEAG